MIVKIYTMIWALVGISAIGLYAAGQFTALIIIAYGFICFGLTFMGMLAILPATIHNERHSITEPVKSGQASIGVRHKTVKPQTEMIKVIPAAAKAV